MQETDIPNDIEQTQDAQTLTASSSRASSQGKILVAEKFLVDPSRPLLEFSHLYADAYECSSDGIANDCVAVVIRDRYPARQDIIRIALQADTPGIMMLRTSAIVEWTNEGTEKFVLIYRRPSGDPIVNRHTQRRQSITEDILRRNIMRPVFFALRSLSDRGIFHGNVRPDNVFFSGNENAEAILGECISSLPGINQPVLYETIERGMTDPAGRGIGTPQDDIYSFGALVSVILRGEEPMQDKTDKQIIEEKVNRSSFSFFTDGMRLSPGMSEFLRATLNDDPKQRWSIDQVSGWIDGTRTTPKQTAIGNRAQRGLDFNDKKYFRSRLLARDLPENIPEAVAMIESGHLSKWIERSLGDLERLEAVNDAITRVMGGGKGQGYEDKLVAYVSMALDPRAPIRYKGLSVLPLGIGSMMAHLALGNISLQPLAEILSNKIAWLWLEHKDNAMGDTAEQMRRFDVISKTISRRGINFGLERCLYDMCPFLPCLSEYFLGAYVTTGSGLMIVLNRIAPKFKDRKPIDRHIASFISARDPTDNNGFMTSLDSGDKIKYGLALLNLYDGLQRRADVPSLVNLCEWLAKEADHVIQRFYNLNLKEQLQKDLAKEIKTGNLKRIVTLIDNPILLRKDEEDFKRATLLYKAIGTETVRMRTELDRNPTFGQGSGQHFAMVISAILSGVVVIGMIVINFLTFLQSGKL